jgi:hypothetical protein
MSLPQKKKVMTGLRVGVIPKYSRRQEIKEPRWKQHTDIVRLLSDTGQPSQDISMHDVWYLLAPLLATPTRRAILSVALRCSELLENGLLKPLYEYSVLVDYSPWSSYFDLLYH